ncbi:MAG: PAS domain S-box protein [Deltaproteobacteria bacterium]|nr:MAG: PAS domain S-box protein [Deltaproteobacteria bacterium]
MPKRPRSTKPRSPRKSGTYRALRKRLLEAEQTLQAIRSGEVDAIVVGGPGGDRVFTLAGADHDYRVLMDEMSEGVATLAKDGLVSYCNARFASILGLPAERIVGSTIFGILPSAAKERVAALLQAGLLTVSKGEFELGGEDGAVKTVLISVSKVAMDTGITQCVIATDLSEEKRREQEVAAERAERDAALRASEERYRQIVETAVEGIWLVDTDGRTTFANRALAEMLEYAPSDLRGQPIFDLMNEESAAAARRFLGRRRRYSELREFGFRAKSGREVWALLSMSPIEDHRGRYLGAVVMVSDVSDRRKLQAQLMLADRMSSLGTLSAGVAHEINNPLAYVIASLDLVADRLPEIASMLGREGGQFLEQQVQRAREGTDRVRKIVRDLKSFSRADEETVTVTDLVKSLNTSLTLVWNEIKHRARLVKDFDRLPPVRANEARLGQVFINLFVNAAQAMPEGNIEHNELRVVGRTDALGNAVVEIHDTGCGIPPDHLDRIFEPFFTTKPVGEGTGLGLAICHGIVTSLGGTLSVQETAVGKGTVFRVVLPAAKSTAESVHLAPRLVPRPKRRGRILVIDDEKDLTDVTREGLAGLHDVMTTQDARQALEWIGAGARFDLILCDMMMPLMTGMEFHMRLATLNPEQADRVVFMTGGAFTPRAREFLARLPNLRLEKPFDLGHVLSMVNAHLDIASRPASLGVGEEETHAVPS